jgi:hypothetical protein
MGTPVDYYKIICLVFLRLVFLEGLGPDLLASLAKTTFQKMARSAAKMTQTRDNPLYGLKIYENPNLTVPGPPIQVPRTWKERFFSKPWKPWQATKTIVPMVPSKQIIKLPDGALVMHPEMHRELRKQLG